MIGGRGSWTWAIRILGFGFIERHARKRHVLSAVMVVTMSVIPLIIAIFLINGMSYGITKKYILLSSYHGQISGQLSEEQQNSLGRKLNEDQLVEAAYTAKEAFCILYSQDSSYNTMVKGVDPAYLRSPDVREQLQITAGDENYFSDPEKPQLVLSRAIADELDTEVGDTVAVVAVSYQENTSRIRPAMYTVTSIIESGYTQLDRQLAFVPFGQSSRLIPESPDSTFTGVIFRDAVGEDITAIRNLLESYAPEGRITTWDQLNSSVYYNFRTSKTILYLIMILIIFIAAVNIASTSILIVQEKHLEIGLLKSLGIPLSTINSSFMITSLLIGLTGSVAGTAVGILLSTRINWFFRQLQHLQIAALDFYLVDIPIIFNVQEIAAVVITTILFSGLVSLVPLRRIRTIVPIHLLQE